ncbi:Flavoprotein [Glarea lozoyensis ATCC 20868]|uniref:tRNA 4-demethylwyosine synthase (AdoMet-dependent) n=1 Tax=Glarea lozoyensis (strain ATCC 20868 / MF5171) TaxID=1116229 RepID=S3CRV2_GLAL2|nr:Flavoprotein [Glarea lozoyensis ATCC 20868]EPE28400.1 Flavoprotein [Glarea lozoyensis ATCC 20868]
MKYDAWILSNVWPFNTSAYAEAVEVWHEYRIPIIISTFTILMIVRTVLHTRLPREKLSITPPPASPTLAAEKKIAPVGTGNKKPISEKVTEKVPRRIVGGVKKRNSSQDDVVTGDEKIQVLVFFSSLTTTTEKTAKVFTEGLAQKLKSVNKASRFIEPEILDLSYIDYDEYFINPPKSDSNVQYFYLLLVPTYNIDTVLDNFLEHLQETHNDFRIDTAPLSPLLGYSVFGFGDREGWPTEADGFCSQATDIDKWMAKLTARKRAFPLGMGDPKTDATERLKEWKDGVEDILEHIAETGGLGEGVVGSGDAVESDVEDVDEDDDGEVLFAEQKVAQKKTKSSKKDDMNDMEDLGKTLNKIAAEAEESGEIEIDFTNFSKKAKKPTAAPVIKEMVPKDSPTFNSLTKQGYSIVGSHSGVKICRWTKSALRGRGSCYKYSFYGIASHQCMETTPSLSCSNKCVFCWRHGTNPVGTTWRWVVDPPEMIFDGVKAGHYKKIKMLRGVPGVRSERFAEAMRIRHCALSLVGEPIFYPHINEFLSMLHAERISSFLVCNAQHPDQLATLKHVTQLYVSIDASNRESLRKIDRPLHRDFWERFNACLDILKKRRFEQRTVFRLTLVKGFNIDDEVEGYAALVEQGLPCFVEIKGVTYCGTSSSASAGLTMQNVPFYSEIQEFVLALTAALQKRGLGYGIAAEHAHSCCVLIASDRFKNERGKWCTRIDYQRFFELLEGGGEFRPEDYMGEETPDWAQWGNGGFDPRDERVYRKGKNKVPLAVKAEEEEGGE